MQHTPLWDRVCEEEKCVIWAPLASFSIAHDIVYILLSILVSRFSLFDSRLSAKLCKQIEIVQNICIFRGFERIISVMRFGSCSAAASTPRCMWHVASAKWQSGKVQQQLHLQSAKLATVGRRQMESS